MIARKPREVRKVYDLRSGRPPRLLILRKPFANSDGT